MRWGQGPGLGAISPHLSRRDGNGIVGMVKWLGCGIFKKVLGNK
jgi:hypothetical protein